MRPGGRADPLACAVRKKAADSLRIAGDCGRAGILYQELADMAQDSDDPADHADRAEGLLGAAECRIPFGDLATAVEAIAFTVRVLAELRHGQSVEELLGQIDDWERRDG